MHTVVRRYHLEDGDIDEVMHRVDASFADKLGHEPGFIAYECLKAGTDHVTTISTFTDVAGCDRSMELAAAFVRDELSDMKLTLIDAIHGDVAVSRAAREVLEPAHA
jgi:hypothetical protein